MIRHAFIAAVAASLAGSLVAQSWAESIEARWPGDRIKKVSELEFTAFVRDHAAVGSLRDARDAFLRLQYAAYGFDTIADGRFLVPAGSSTFARRPTFGLDAVVQENAEPNGDPSVTPGSMPTMLPGGAEGHGETLVGGDVDWWRFDLPFAGDVVAWVGPGPTPAQTDPILTLLDSNSQIIQVNDDRNDLFPQIEAQLQAGTYYLAVEPFDPTLDIGNYTIDLVTVPLGAGNPRPRIAEGPEPNGAGGTPTPIVCPEVADGEIGVLGDEDHYTISVPPLRLRIRTLPPLAGVSSAPNLEDSTLELRDASGNTIAMDDINGPSYHSEISVDVPGGAYTIVVGGYQGSVTGGYQLLVDCEPPFATASEAPEPNGDPGATPAGTPTPVSCNTVVQGAISGVGDRDWYELDLTRGSLVIASTGDPTGPAMPLADSVMQLLDADGNALDASDNGFYTSLYSRVERVLPPGKYYIDVGGYATTTGAYSLQVECISGYAGLVLQGDGCVGSNGTPTFFERTSPLFGETFEAPVIGGTFSIDAAGLPANAPVLGLVGLSDTNYLGVPLPFDLALLGAPGCLVRTSIDAQVVLSTSALGELLWALDVPFLPPIVDGTIYMQLLALDPSAAGGLTVSNAAAAVIGNRVRWIQRLDP